MSFTFHEGFSDQTTVAQAIEAGKKMQAYTNLAALSSNDGTSLQVHKSSSDVVFYVYHNKVHITSEYPSHGNSKMKIIDLVMRALENQIKWSGETIKQETSRQNIAKQIIDGLTKFQEELVE